MAIISNATTIADAGAFSVSLGSMVHIKTLTASSSATLSFVDGTDSVVLDSTYPIYVFKFINIHPADNSRHFGVGFRDGGTDYDAVKTTTMIKAHHYESDSSAALAYNTGEDLAQSTAFQYLASDVGNLDDECASGTMQLFNPSSTTFVKHFISKANCLLANEQSIHFHVSGYVNTTTAIDGVQFKMSSGNIDSGKIKLYGVKDS